MNRTRIRGPSGRRHVRPEVAQLRRPDVGVAAFVAGDPPEGVGSVRVLLDRRQRVVQDDRVAFQLEVVEALLDVDGGHGVIVGHRRRVDSRPCLVALDPGAALPVRGRRHGGHAAARRAPGLAERTLTALVADAELPPKIGDPSPAGGLVRPCHAGLPARRRSRWRRGPGRHEVGRRVRHQQRPGHAVDQRGRRAQRRRDRAADRDPRRRADHRDADGGRVRRGDPAVRAGASPGGRPAPRSSGPGRRAAAISRCSGTCCRESR